jgi:hypothetical protein
LGFIEAEGTFGFKNISPYFQLAQHTKNIQILNIVSCYLKNLPKTFKFSNETKFATINTSIFNSVAVISISDIDSLHDFLMYYFLNLPFQTRKSEDFYF